MNGNHRIVAAALLLGLSACASHAPAPMAGVSEPSDVADTGGAMSNPGAGNTDVAIEAATPPGAVSISALPISRPEAITTATIPGAVTAPGNVAQAVLPVMPAQPSSSSLPATLNPPLGRAVRAEDILRLPPDYFAVQLVAFRDKTDVLQFIADHHLGDPAYGRILRQGEPWYVLLYGVWASRDEADAAIAGMPAELRALSPWVRRLGDLQNAIRATAQ